MTIHHATVARAAKLGVVLTEEDGLALAHHTERNKRIENEDPKAALAFVLVAAHLAVEYPHITITDDGAAEADDENFYNIDPDMKLEDTIAELLEVAPVGEDEEEGTGPVVVAERYKSEYKARGDASGCGDWLHQTLKRYSSEWLDHEGNPHRNFDEPSFTQMLVANGIEIKGKFATMPDSGAKGWEGRYRMNGRQMLEGPVLRAKGVLVLEDGTELAMPSEDYDELLSKPRHRTLREEIETAEAEADAAAETAAKKAKAKGRAKK